MDYFETYKDLSENIRGCVIVIGNFDGVHLGHKALLEHAKAIAQEKNSKVGILTFDPHPRQLFRADEPFRRIMPHALKIEHLKQSGADVIFSLPFDWEFASLPAQDFVQQILIEGLAASHVVIGHDFKFGQLRKGNAQTISAAGLSVSAIDEVTGSGETGEISSSHIRQYIQDGKIEQANEILGWPWEIRGEIIKGDQRGRKLGYPTANMELGDSIHPAYGVYACLACLRDEAFMNEGHWYDCVVNIGIRPMFEVKKALVETHIFDFDRDIYGQVLCVQPVKRLRGEAKFDSLEKLVKQIGRDCAEARKSLQG
ncbi:MAG: bifunctional riboflavin kinase/FAD synthetase [Alphaproteobacteria bacterium]|nr:bifunctional riboflavin kinase/FAD synthetase [Alphaproteobacteria bacterium]